MRRTSRRLRSNSRSRGSLRVAAFDAAKRVFVLAKKWERTGRFDRAEMEAARDAAAYAADDAADDAAYADADAAAAAYAAAATAYSILEGRGIARTHLAELRQILIDLGVDVAVLEREAGLRKNSRRRTSRRLRARAATAGK